MSKFYGYNPFETPAVKDLWQMAKENLSKRKNYEPVLIEGTSRKICKSWWGDAWCRNLERYADWSNRIGRGKTYVRNGAVIDLKINGGEIYAKVQGSRKKPYTTKIAIDPIDEKSRLRIEEQASGKIQNLEALINGTFPEDLKELFFQEKGLFPSPEEIHFNCSCPDLAIMCKHVAAALFGVGMRLDANPIYFFQMRGIDVESFVAKIIGGKVETMLRNAKLVTPRIIQESNLNQLFGI